ncbi:putative WRKY transcription factor protein 1 isoform X1 [Vespula maculifrons]|uniref:WRKY transcription factor protein 1 isoform X1 n=1 Tax=Vespula maculifrons TaxID=7453 RepID=A0ABD2BB74_VESMC
MRLSTVLELLLILLLVAFAAYGRVIDSGLVAVNRSIRASNVPKQSIESPIITEATENVNRYCTCSDVICNCCRNFHIPLVQLKGPGCASLQYLKDDNLAVQLSFGDNILTSTIVNGKNPKPVCVPLPGGFSKFCGRVYSIKRDVDNHFKACLGLELQSSTELEASLRVSCFRFGPDGLKLRPAEPFPIVESEQSSEEDDDDDLFGLGSDDDEDDDDDDDDPVRPSLNSVSDNIGSNVGSTDEEDEEDDDDDVLGFGALLDIITGDDEIVTKKPKVTTAPPLLQFTIPILTRPSTASSDSSVEESSTDVNDALILQTLDSQNNNHQEDYGQELNDIEEQVNNENQDGLTEADLLTDLTTDESIVETNQNGGTNKLVKPTSNHKIKKIGTGNNKKPSITSSSINAINDDIKKKNKKKPVKKPIEDEDEDDDVLDDDDDDDDDLDDLNDDDDDDDDEDEDDDFNDNEEGQDVDSDEDDEKTDDLDDLDDDDDEEEDAVLSALVEDDKPKVKKNKIITNKGQSSRPVEEDDYSIGITDFLSRKKQDGRQSRIMRL